LHYQRFVHEDGVALDARAVSGEDFFGLVVVEVDAEFAENAHGCVVDALCACGVERLEGRQVVARRLHGWASGCGGLPFSTFAPSVGAAIAAHGWFLWLVMWI